VSRSYSHSCKKRTVGAATKLTSQHALELSFRSCSLIMYCFLSQWLSTCGK
jgi:hypothetical protein